MAKQTLNYMCEDALILEVANALENFEYQPQDSSPSFKNFLELFNCLFNTKQFTKKFTVSEEFQEQWEALPDFEKQELALRIMYTLRLVVDVSSFDAYAIDGVFDSSEKALEHMVKHIELILNYYDGITLDAEVKQEQ